MKSYLKILSVFALTALLFTSCKDDDFYLQNTPELSVSINEIAVNTAGGVYTIDVQSTRRWFITSTAEIGSWFDITPIWQERPNGEIVFGGENNGQITVTALANTGGPRRATLSVETAGGLLRQVDIVQQGAWNEVLLFAENMGTVNTSTPWPTVANFTGWNTTGQSAESITFSSSGGTVDVRSNAVSNFPGASGGNNVMFSTGGAGVFYVNGIVPGDIRNFSFSFGTNQTNYVISVSFSTNNGETWIPVNFEKTTETWGLVETRFDIENAASSLRLRIAGGPTQFGARIDDLRLDGLVPN